MEQTIENLDGVKNVLRANGVADRVLEGWSGMIAPDAMALPDGDDVMRIANYIGWTDVAEANREFLSTTTPGDVKDFLDANRGKPVTFLLNTPGGSVFGGTEIANLIIGHDADTLCIVTGVAASVGSLIAAACSDVQMMEASMVMIHGPHTFGYGGAQDFRDVAERLDKEAAAVSKIYKRRMDDAKVDEMLASGDHYMTADEAVKSGIADGIYSAASGGEEGKDAEGDSAQINTDDKPEDSARSDIAKREQDRLAFLTTGMLYSKEMKR